MKLSLYILAFTLFSVSLYAGGGHSHHVLVRPVGTMWAWGANDFGQLGDASGVNTNIPVQVNADNEYVNHQEKRIVDSSISSGMKLLSNGVKTMFYQDNKAYTMTMKKT